MAELRGLLGARLVLVAAMALSAALILWLGRGTGFTGDDLFYYARLVNRGIGVDHYHHLSLEYLLAPHNNHMQLVGKLIYEGLSATAGPSTSGTASSRWSVSFSASACSSSWPR